MYELTGLILVCKVLGVLMWAALVLSLVLVASVEVWLCQDSLFHSVQEKTSNGNDQLLCYYLAVIAS